MRNNNKGNSLIDFICVVFIVMAALAIIAAVVGGRSTTEEESEERIVESSKVVKEGKIEKYMVIVYKNDSSCDTLYSSSEGKLKSVGEFIFYNSDDIDSVSKNTIISIPITAIPTKYEYDDMHEFSSGIYLDNY